MSALQTVWPAPDDTEFADRTPAAPQRIPAEPDESPAEKDVSDWVQTEPLMTLITPCEPPRHSKWHLVSGMTVLAVAYVIVMAYIRWLTH